MATGVRIKGCNHLISKKLICNYSNFINHTHMKKVNSFLLILFLMVSLMKNTDSFSQAASLKAGIAKVDITPTESLYMGGYDESGRPDPSNGVYGKIYIRALVFDDNSRRVAFIETDVVSFPNKDYLPVRQLISEKTGIPVENIILGCVHNHAAPVPGEKNSNSTWNKNLNNNFVKAVKDAIADLEPVKIGGGTGKSYIAMNRRKRMNDTLSYISFDENNSSQSYGKYKTNNPVKIREMDGVYRLGANPSGSIDDEVGIMRIDKLSGAPKAVFVNYACHGTSLGARNNKISPEWNGHMLEYIERQVPGVTGIFAQGAAGDINPRFVGGLDGCKDNLENTAMLGYEIGKEVLKVFNTIKTDLPVNPEIKMVSKNITCPKRYGDVMKDFKNTTIDVNTTAIRIDDFVWVTFPGELFHEIGQTIKASSHSRYPFFVGYSNGSLGYLPTAQAHSEGGYEPWSTRFDPAAEKIYVAGVKQLLLPLQ
jgi:neutral ceramidase